MDIRSLQLFDHLARSLHFSRTAEAMFVSPSTLSRAVQRLEEEVGAPLFHRNNRSVRLTAAGERLQVFARGMLEQWQNTKLDIQKQDQVLRGELQMFCSVTASYSHLPPLLDSFRQRHPQAEIRLTTGDPAQSIQHVVNEQTDISIAVYSPDMPANLHFQPLDTLPLVMVCPATYRITRFEQVHWQSMPMIMPDSGPSKRIVHHWLAERGIRPRVYASVSGHEAIVSMVALGCGVGIVPKAVVDYSVVRDKVSVIPLADIESFRLGLCCLQQRANEPLMTALLDQVS